VDKSFQNKFLDIVKIDEKFIEGMYNLESVRRFYDANEIMLFKNKWVT